MRIFKNSRAFYAEKEEKRLTKTWTSVIGASVIIISSSEGKQESFRDTCRICSMISDDMKMYIIYSIFHSAFYVVIADGERIPYQKKCNLFQMKYIEQD